MINLVHLKYFFDTARFGSFADAAKLNFVTRPAISQAIRSLELDLGVDLFIHARNRAELTERGKWLAEHAAELLKQAKNLEMEIQSAEIPHATPVRLCSSHSLALRILPSALLELQKHSSGMPLQLRMGNAIETRRLLRERQVDVGLVVDDGQFAGFEKKVLFEGEFILARANQKSSESTFIVGDHGLEVETLKRWLFLRKKTNLTFVEVQSWEVIAQFCAQGLGLGWIPDFMLKGESADKIHRVRGNHPDFLYKVCLVAISFSDLSDSAQRVTHSLCRVPI